MADELWNSIKLLLLLLLSLFFLLYSSTVQCVLPTRLTVLHQAIDSVALIHATNDTHANTRLLVDYQQQHRRSTPLRLIQPHKSSLPLPSIRTQHAAPFSQSFQQQKLQNSPTNNEKKWASLPRILWYLVSFRLISHDQSHPRLSDLKSHDPPIGQLTTVSKKTAHSIFHLRYSALLVISLHWTLSIIPHHLVSYHYLDSSTSEPHSHPTSTAPWYYGIIFLKGRWFVDPSTPPSLSRKFSLDATVGARIASLTKKGKVHD